MTDTASPRKPHKFYVGLLILLTLWMSLPGIASMQVIDRDEARYAQATVQMVESGDYLNIRFQDRARNKKPAGIYWMQAAFVKAFTDPGERKIWTHRIVSVLGALLAVLATYWGAIAVLGRRGAFWSAAFLATSLLMAFEAHIAKTDAMLCGFSALCLAALIRLQKGDSFKTAFIFWVALGAAIMIKGPITPAIILITLSAYVIWEKDAAWLKRLINIPGILVAILMVVPWMIAIGLATDGAFFKDAVGGDLAPKLAGGQEKHGGWPGYYTLTLPVFFWPGILLLLPGLWFAKLTASAKSNDVKLRQSIRLLICWVLPFWLILELVPTKLPNYPLPLYPALAIFVAGAFTVLKSIDTFKKSRQISSAIFLLIAMVLLGVIFAAEWRYSDAPTIAIWALPILLALAFAAAIFTGSGKAEKGIICALTLTLLLTPITYGLIFPNLDDLRLGARTAAALDTQSIKSKRVLSPNFTEPSLVYNLGTNILLGDKADAAIAAGIGDGDLIIIDQKAATEFHGQAYLLSQISMGNNCLSETTQIDGFNYSRGDDVELKIYSVGTCPIASSP